jgi:hypothetical protein
MPTSPRLFWLRVTGLVGTLACGALGCGVFIFARSVTPETIPTWAPTVALAFGLLYGGAHALSDEARGYP